MPNLLNAKDFTSSKNGVGFLVLGFLLLLLIFLAFLYPLNIFTSRVLPVFLVLILISLLALKVWGVFLKIPLKIYDEGISIQTKLRFKPLLLNFPEIRQIKFIWGYQATARGYVYTSECEITASSEKRYTSKENFIREGLIGFVNKIMPILRKQGFQLQSKVEEKYVEYRFYR